MTEHNLFKHLYLTFLMHLLYVAPFYVFYVNLEFPLFNALLIALPFSLILQALFYIGVILLSENL